MQVTQSHPMQQIVRIDSNDMLNQIYKLVKILLIASVFYLLAADPPPPRPPIPMINPSQ